LAQLTPRQYLHDHKAVVFEKSPSYIDLADPRDVARLLPRAKMVFLTRDPVPRLLSAYFQYCEGSDQMVRPAGDNCTIEEFERLAMQLTNTDSAFVGHNERHFAFIRAAKYGKYEEFLSKWLHVFWTEDSSIRDKQFLCIDADHFRVHPKAVLYAIESFVGIHGSRHFEYNPKMKDGYYVYGYTSKA
jgi:hypothetical protein